jgi:20S proteasome alpha/beta subunit
LTVQAYFQKLGGHGRKPMTVCIAAACDEGARVVMATDGLLSYGPVTADNMISKFTWLDDWCCMFAGEPSNVEMIFEELDDLAPGEKLTRANIKKLLLAAYQRRQGKWLAAKVLSPYDLSLEEFKKDGLKMFGESEFSRLSKAIHEHSFQYSDQLLVVGWGKTPHATMMHQIDPDGDRDHKYTGVAAIGAGQEVAVSTLLLLGQSRQSSLEETLYSVAAAKFSAEKSQGQSVGQNTAMYITWKRTEKDNERKPVGIHVQPDEIAELRQLWEDYGKPRIPDEGWNVIDKISRKLGFNPTLSRGWIEFFNRVTERERRRAEKAANSRSVPQESNSQKSEGQP